MSRPILLYLLADARRQCGLLDEAVAALDEALALAEACEERLWEAELCRLRGELAVSRPEAERWIRRAVDVATTQGTPVLLRRAEASLARLAARPAAGLPGS